MTKATWFSSLLLAAFVIQAAPAFAEAAEAAPTGSGKNVQVTLTISRAGGSSPSQRVLKLIGQEASRARMLVGWRTPIPTTSKTMDEGGKGPAMNYIYQNVGVSAELMVNLVGQGRIMLDGQIEISGAREGPPVGAGGEKAPLIGTFQQSLRVIVADGKKLRIAEAPDPEGGTVSLDIEATVLP